MKKFFKHMILLIKLTIRKMMLKVSKKKFINARAG
jgi:hypothetical protein